MKQTFTKTIMAISMLAATTVAAQRVELDVPAAQQVKQPSPQLPNGLDKPLQPSKAADPAIAPAAQPAVDGQPQAAGGSDRSNLDAGRDKVKARDGLEFAAELPVTERKQDTPLEVVQAYLSAWLSGEYREAARWAQPGKVTASEKSMKSNRDLLNVDSLQITTLLTRPDGIALAATEQIELDKPQPDGVSIGSLTLTLHQTDGRWLVSDIDFDGPAGLRRAVERFRNSPDGLPVAMETVLRKPLPRVYHLQHADVSDVAGHLESLLPTSATVVADQRTNSLVIASDAAQHKEIDVIVRTLDTTNKNPLPVSVGRIHLFPLQHASAANLVPIFSSLFRFDTGLEQKTLVVADEATNQLIALCDEAQLPAIQRVISELDRPSDHGSQQNRSQWAPAIQKTDDGQPGIGDQAESPEIGELLASLRAQGKNLAPAHLTDMKTKLRNAVTREFAHRQQQQRAELAKLQLRLERIQTLIESREKVREEIISRRVEELLNPALHWNSTPVPDTGHSTSAPDTINESPAPETSKHLQTEQKTGNATTLVWELLGVKLRQVARGAFPSQVRYRGGMQIVELRRTGPAEKIGLRLKDTIVGMDRWETTSLDDLVFALQQSGGADGGERKLFVVRQNDTLYTRIRLPNSAMDVESVTTPWRLRES